MRAFLPQPKIVYLEMWLYTIHVPAFLESTPLCSSFYTLPSSNPVVGLQGQTTVGLQGQTTVGLQGQTTVKVHEYDYPAQGPPCRQA